MTIEEKIEASVTRNFKAVFPNTTNHYDTLFGGHAMQLMDEIAFIAATRFCRKKVVTVNSGKIDFAIPIPSGSLIELVAKVERVGRTSMDVKVDIFVEQMYADHRERAVEGIFTLVAIDDEKNPVPIFSS